MRIRDPEWKHFGSGIRDGKNSDPLSGTRTVSRFKIAQTWIFVVFSWVCGSASQCIWHYESSYGNVPILFVRNLLLIRILNTNSTILLLIGVLIPQAARPHTIDGKTVETKRATPREEGRGGYVHHILNLKNVLILRKACRHFFVFIHLNNISLGLEAFPHLFV
jgi:hypothetical protein